MIWPYVVSSEGGGSNVQVASRHPSQRLCLEEKECLTDAAV